LAEAEEGKQKPEGEKKLDSLSSAVRQWQTFALAVIIIFAYVVFFAWIISTAPLVTENGNTVRDYRGMTSLTGTFGIIAAAVVGYYFGQRNLEQATKTAESATKMLSQANEVADKKTVEEKESKNLLKNEIKKGTKFYETFDKITNPKEKDKKVEDVIQEHEKKSIKEVNDDIIRRKGHLEELSKKLEDQE